MLLRKLIKNLPKKISQINILGLASNSKKVKKGFIFFAIDGHNANGEEYIKEAIKNGAVVIVCSEKSKIKDINIPILKTKNVRFLLSEITSKFYKLKPKNIIAVTGTNGKTSVADFFYQILNINNVPVASIGTLGIKYKSNLVKSRLTSPDTISLHSALERIKKNKIDNVIIEASSHGLDQKRIDHLNLKAALFTNFSHDHLDYHKTMKSYLNAKLRLFKKILPKRRIIISDKQNKQYPILKKIAAKKKQRLIDINSLEEKLTKIKNLKFNEFQIKNLSMAIASAKLCNLKEKKIFNSLDKIKNVNGRLELIRIFPNNVKTFVDFAHTPDALMKSLEALKNSFGNNISVVFGCGGDRDYKKRPLMARIADSYCKKIYITDDNPRNEKPQKIREEIIKKIKNTNKFNIGDRAKAIKNAIINADPNEIILVAGKGHETDQIYKNKVISISDKKIIKKLKLKLKKLNLENQNYLQNNKIFKEIQKKYKSRNFHGLAIDSRVVKKNNLFLTIKGKNNDGSDFINQAISKGAINIVTSKNIRKLKNKSIKVNNEIKFLNDFAYKKRTYTTAKIFAITGSAGKTSLKDLIKNLLQYYGKTFCSPKSYNNQYGVPLSLSNLKTYHTYGVFEVGMSKAGEINNLSKIIRPHIGIITNIGEAHIENFKNVKGIADAKGEIINNIEKNGTIILNRDDKYFKYFHAKAKLKKIKIISFGMKKNADIYVVSIKKVLSLTKLVIKVKDQVLKLEVKDINIYNVLASLALLNELKLDIKKVIKHFKNIMPSDGRGKVHNIKRYNKSFKLIDESYNANPLSVVNAIRNFNLIKKKKFKKYLFLGDMLELGRKSEILHKGLSKVINNSDIDKVFIRGTKTLATFRNIDIKKRGNIFQQEEDVDYAFKNIIANNDYLMIKGSNATGLNNFSKKIIKGF